MPLPSNLFTTAFRENRLGFVFAAIVAILVYLASLAMAAQVVLGASAAGWGQSIAGRATIEIPSPSEGMGAGPKEKTDAVVRLLQDLPGIKSATPLSRADIAQLLKPWIDDPLVLPTLPLPLLIDIEMAQGPVDQAAIQQAIAPVAPDAKIDLHAQWIQHLAGFLANMSMLAGIMVGLMTLALIMAIVLICRLALAMQHETIDLLHLMGATDTDIAAQFQRRIAHMALLPSIAGFVLALGTFGLLAMMFTHIAMTGFDLGQSMLLWGSSVAIVPVAAVGVAVVTARLSVIRLLRRMP